MHRSVLVMNSVVCTKFHGYRPNFEAEKRIIKVGPEKNPTKLHARIPYTLKLSQMKDFEKIRVFIFANEAH